MGKPAKGISFIIAAAGTSYNVRFRAPKCLAQYDGKCAISHQIGLIREMYRNSQHEIIVGVGYKHEDVCKHLNDVTVVVNEDYEITNTAHTIGQCAEHTLYNKIVIVHSDVIFDWKSITVLDEQKSYLAHSNTINQNKIGINSLNNNVIGFSYKATKKWGQVAILNKKEANLLREIDINYKWCSHELLNEIIRCGGSFSLRDNCNITEVNHGRK